MIWDLFSLTDQLAFSTWALIQYKDIISPYIHNGISHTGKMVGIFILFHPLKHFQGIFLTENYSTMIYMIFVPMSPSNYNSSYSAVLRLDIVSEPQGSLLL